MSKLRTLSHVKVARNAKCTVTAEIEKRRKHFKQIPWLLELNVRIPNPTQIPSERWWLSWMVPRPTYMTVMEATWHMTVTPIQTSNTEIPELCVYILIRITVSVAQFRQQGVNDEGRNQKQGRHKQEIRINGLNDRILLAFFRLRRETHQCLQFLQIEIIGSWRHIRQPPQRFNSISL
jgi:hypothetical protein